MRESAYPGEDQTKLQPPSAVAESIVRTIRDDFPTGFRLRVGWLCPGDQQEAMRNGAAGMPRPQLQFRWKLRALPLSSRRMRMPGLEPPSLLGLVAAIGVAGAAQAIPPPANDRPPIAPRPYTPPIHWSVPVQRCWRWIVPCEIGSPGLDPKLLTSRPPYIEDQSARFRRRSTCAFRTAQAVASQPLMPNGSPCSMRSPKRRIRPRPMDCKPTCVVGRHQGDHPGRSCHPDRRPRHGARRRHADGSQGAWRPFARLKKEGRSFSVQDVGNGKPLRCEPAD